MTAEQAYYDAAFGPHSHHNPFAEPRLPPRFRCDSCGMESSGDDVRVRLACRKCGESVKLSPVPCRCYRCKGVACGA